MVKFFFHPLIYPRKNLALRHSSAQRRKGACHDDPVSEKLGLSHIAFRDQPMFLSVPDLVFPALRISAALVGCHGESHVDEPCTGAVKAPEEMVVIRPDLVLKII